MTASYEVQARLAAEAERRGDALAAAVRWCLAAETAGYDLARVRALGGARRCAELALHQAVYLARDPERVRHLYTGEEWAPYDPPKWRALASAAGVPVSTLNRLYRRRPARMPPAAFVVYDEDLERLMDPSDWMEDGEPDDSEDDD